MSSNFNEIYTRLIRCKGIVIKVGLVLEYITFVLQTAVNRTVGWRGVWQSQEPQIVRKNGRFAIVGTWNLGVDAVHVREAFSGRGLAVCLVERATVTLRGAHHVPFPCTVSIDCTTDLSVPSSL